MEIIQSKDNELIRETRKLKEKRFRLEKEEFLVEGFRFVEEALQSTFEVLYLFISEKQKEKWESSGLESKLKSNTRIYWVGEVILKNISSTETPQGIVAVVKNKNIEIKDEVGFYVLADKIQDPGNMGTIIRSAHASGALGVIVTKGTVDVYNEKTLRSTMGSVFKIPIIIEDGLETLLSLKAKGFKVLVSSLEATENFYQADLRGKIVIAVGNEGAGISEEVQNLGDIVVKIPMIGDAESLNVAVAASIMMFEAVRQKLDI